MSGTSKSMIALTFDTDHMSEERMREFLERIPISGSGTFFCTQHYDCLRALHHELAPHPYLGSEADALAELKRMREMFPAARGWRSHSCVYSHILAEWIGKNGYAYASTSDRLGSTGLRPVREAFGVFQMPIYYMDNLDFSDQRFWGGASRAPFTPAIISTALEEPGCYVFDFHPIHLMLNSPTAEYYFERRDLFKDGAYIESLAYHGTGARTFFLELQSQMARYGAASVTLSDMLAKVA